MLPAITDETRLTPASRDKQAQVQAFALRFNPRGKAHRMAWDAMAHITAQALARRLELSGFVVMKRPPRAGAQHAEEPIAGWWATAS